jgi:nicotinate phosphoribosyltransferase
MTDALTTDLYELNMAASYLRRGLSEPATFSLFVRALPPNRGFLVAAGLEDCLAHLEAFAFTDEELTWLESAGFDHETITRFEALRFTGDVFAIAEGRVVFANEPILEVTAPIAEAQLVETFLLNQVGYQTALATKAARCRLAAGDMQLVDFALRRTQGTEAGMAFARLSSIAGFVATSNVAAARRYGLPTAGTMAHSYVQAFRSEREAFVAFAEDIPGRVTFLVDTYDTARGIDAAIDVIKDLKLTEGIAVRLDSGDLVATSQMARRKLDEAGLSSVHIFVSGGLDEHDLEAFQRARAPIDAVGLGGRIGVAQDAPTLDTAYKLVQLGPKAVVKLSPGKDSLPGAKQVWRRTPIDRDLLATRDEPGPAGAEPLLQVVMVGGRRVTPTPSLDEARQRLAGDLDRLPAAARRLRDPVPPAVELSPRLTALRAEAQRQALKASVSSLRGPEGHA